MSLAELFYAKHPRRPRLARATRNPRHVRLWRHSHGMGTSAAERGAGLHHRRLRDAGPRERRHEAVAPGLPDRDAARVDRETWGNGFVTRIELLDVADTLHT